VPAAKQIWLSLIFSTIFYLAFTQEAFALRCGGKLITEGDSKLTVKNLCGKPDWVDRWLEETIEQPDTDFEHSITQAN
jgi:hypothetical protein